MEDGKSETKLNFRYFIKMALQKKISWDMLLVFLDDLTPTLVQSKQAIEVLVKELQTLQSKQQNNEVDQDKTVEIIDNEASNATMQKTQPIAADLTKTNENSTISQSEKDGKFSNESSTEIRQPKVISQNDEVNLSSENYPQIFNFEKEVSEAVEVIQLDGEEELPIQFKQRSLINQNDLSKDNENCKNLSFQINGEDCSIEFEDTNLIDVGNVSIGIEREIVAEYAENINSEHTKISMLTRTKNEPCQICEKTFASRSSLINHKRIHSAEQAYQCNICHNCFIKSSDLKIHRMIHSGEKPFQCSTCKKSFARSSGLKCHSRIHTAEKPYPCKTCKKCFTNVANLKRHERIHTGERPYQCKTCNKSFNQSGALKDHQKRYHNL